MDTLKNFTVVFFFFSAFFFLHRRTRETAQPAML